MHIKGGEDGDVNIDRHNLLSLLHIASLIV